MPRLPQSDYRPHPHEPYMNPRQVAYFHRRLLAWRTELLSEQSRPLAGLVQERAKYADPVDQGVQEIDLQQDVEKLQRIRRLLREIEAALTRIDDGSYGYCLESGEEIGLKRLMALPVATLSVDMQEQREWLRRRRAMG